jgi:hypothetical protein
MTELLINLPDEEMPFFMSLLERLDFVKVKQVEVKKASKTKVRTPEQQEFIDDLKVSLQEVELHLQGKIKLQTLEEALAEL